MPFDPLISSAGRLRILTALGGGEVRSFVELRRSTGLTDGNLSAHARRLESAGLVAIHKAFQGGKPFTSFRLTSAGREALRRHVNTLMAAMQPAAAAARPAAEEREPELVAASTEEDWVD